MRLSLWRGDAAIGSIGVPDGQKLTRFFIALVDVHSSITDLASVWQVHYDGTVFEQDNEPKVLRRRGEESKGPNPFALRPIDREVDRDREFFVRHEDGTPLPIQQLTLNELLLPSDWSEDDSFLYSTDGFVDGRAWEVWIHPGAEIPGIPGATL